MFRIILWELLHGVHLSVTLSKPYDCDSTFSKNLDFLVSSGTSITESFQLLLGKRNFSLWCWQSSSVLISLCNWWLRALRPRFTILDISYWPLH